MLKIPLINPTYPYVYECVVKIVYYSSEDGNKKFNHQHFNTGTGFRSVTFANKTAYLNSGSVADPDPYVFGPLSGSVSQKYGSGSGSFHHQAKNSKKNLDF
jgi:hypothetical protein